MDYSFTSNITNRFFDYSTFEEYLNVFDIPLFEFKSEYCQDAIKELVCLLMQPKCINDNEIIPPCHKVCSGK